MITKQKLERICKEEFEKIKGLCSPKDNIGIVYNEENGIIDYQIFYDSYKWSDKRKKGSQESYLTGIAFRTLKDLPCIGKIMSINVNPNVRGRDFGKGMINAAEKIFKRSGVIAVNVDNITNPGFWEYFGYKLTKNKTSGIKLLE